ncbi:MAG TPA: hypothetical protein VLI04_22235, partial [Nocardioidaceae bacterium]|nr:hypothetical protein [Nocardioidaceae bacterium]
MTALLKPYSRSPRAHVMGDIMHASAVRRVASTACAALAWVGVTNVGAADAATLSQVAQVALAAPPTINASLVATRDT